MGTQQHSHPYLNLNSNWVPFYCDISSYVDTNTSGCQYPVTFLTTLRAAHFAPAEPGPLQGFSKLICTGLAAALASLIACSIKLKLKQVRENNSG